MNVVVHAPVAAAKSGTAESSRTTVVVVCGLGRSGRASWNAASQRLPSLAWPVHETSRQRLIACFASPSVEARDMRMGVVWRGLAWPPSSSHRLPVHQRHCSACASFHPDGNIHTSHYMHASSITHVTFTSSLSITISTTSARHQQLLSKSVSTRPPAALLSWIPTLPPSTSTNKRQITFFSPVALSARNTRPRPPRPPIATLRPCLFLTLAHRRRHARVHLIPKIIFRNTPGPARLQHYLLLARRMLPPSADLPPVD